MNPKSLLERLEPGKVRAVPMFVVLTADFKEHREK